MGEFGGQKAQRYPLTMANLEAFRDEDIPWTFLKKKRYTGLSSSFSYIYIYFTCLLKTAVFRKERNNQTRTLNIEEFPLNKKEMESKKSLQKKMNVLNVFSLQKQMYIKHFLLHAPFGLWKNVEVPRRFPRGALPTRPCHSFVHRSQTQLGDGAYGWGGWQVGKWDAHMRRLRDMV